uniref:Uncharacterized protein n=1 Tax=Oryza meridionalis TaxID=40149 RepID=A0A0E0CV66_9ORYZ
MHASGAPARAQRVEEATVLLPAVGNTLQPAPDLQFRRPQLVDGVHCPSPHRSAAHFVAGEGGRHRTASSSGERCTVSCAHEENCRAGRLSVCTTAPSGPAAGRLHVPPVAAAGQGLGCLAPLHRSRQGRAGSWPRAAAAGPLPTRGDHGGLAQPRRHGGGEPPSWLALAARRNSDAIVRERLGTGAVSDAGRLDGWRAEIFRLAPGPSAISHN